MGQIIGRTAKPDACNIRSLSSFGTPAAGQHILVSTDNSAMQNGQGNFDAYVVGDGKTAAIELPLHKINKSEGLPIELTGTPEEEEERLIISDNNGNVIIDLEPERIKLPNIVCREEEVVVFNEGGNLDNFIKIKDDSNNDIMIVDANGVRVKSISTLDGGGVGVRSEEKICVPIFQSLIANMDFSLYPINGNVAVLGDSTVAGYGVGSKVSSNLTITGTLTDISTSGDTISGQLSKWNNIDAEVKSALNYVIVEIGLNNMTSQSVSSDVQMFQQYQSLIAKIRTDAPNSKIILSKMTPAHGRFINLYGEEQGEVAYNNWLELNDAIKRILFWGASASVDYHVNIMSDDNGNLLSIYDNGDQIHPNSLGGKVIAWSWLNGIFK